MRCGPQSRMTAQPRMRTIRRSSSLMDRLPDPVREFLSRRASEMTGLALLALMAAAGCGMAAAQTFSARTARRKTAAGESSATARG